MAEGEQQRPSGKLGKDDPDLHPGGHNATDDILPFHPRLDPDSKTNPASHVEAGDTTGYFQERTIEDMKSAVEEAKDPGSKAGHN